MPHDGAQRPVDTKRGIRDSRALQMAHQKCLKKYGTGIAQTRGNGTAQTASGRAMVRGVCTLPEPPGASVHWRQQDIVGGGGCAQRGAQSPPPQMTPQPPPKCPPPPSTPQCTPEGMLSYCTWAQDAASTKTQKENWLVSGLKDHRYLSVTRMRHRGASGQATNTQSNGSQQYVMNHRQAGTIGPECTPPPMPTNDPGGGWGGALGPTSLCTKNGPTTLSQRYIPLFPTVVPLVWGGGGSLPLAEQTIKHRPRGRGGVVLKRGGGGLIAMEAGGGRTRRPPPGRSAGGGGPYRRWGGSRGSPQSAA